MLIHLHIKNFAIIDHLELDLSRGMTVITGETGAGKSIIIDALSIALGDRADSSFIRHGAQRCEIDASFEIQSLPAALAWLTENDLVSDDECVIRRVMTVEGRSRHYINGHSVTLQQLREFGTLLVHIHGQHQHQALLRQEEQRELIDNFANHGSLLQTTRERYDEWRQLQQQITQLEQSENSNAHLELLQYQVEELEKLALAPGETEALTQELRQLSHAELVLSATEKALALIEGGSGEYCALICLHETLQSLAAQKQLHPELNNAWELINQAIIHTQEAGYELNHFFGKITLDPERLQTIDHRLGQINDLARKHRVKPEALPEQAAQLSQQLAALLNSGQTLTQLKIQAEAVQADYLESARHLSQSRCQAAALLATQVTASMQQLSLVGGQLCIDCHPHPEPKPQAHGIDEIQFKVSANAGQPPGPLSKVASGGELSRISLAIHVIAAQADCTPTLIFDEVDVGIGGGTAEIVGQLLNQLGKSAQVLCITHLPQVAAQGNHHLKIDKQMRDGNVCSDLYFLTKEQRIQEIARMVGGLTITQQTLAHAQEMLELSGGEAV